MLMVLVHGPTLLELHHSYAFLRRLTAKGPQNCGHDLKYKQNIQNPTSMCQRNLRDDHEPICQGDQGYGPSKIFKVQSQDPSFFC